MDEVEIDADGRVKLDGVFEVVEWDSVRALAIDHWRWSRLGSKENDMAAWECVQALMQMPVAQANTVIQELVDLAETDQELCNIGAGPLEDLLSHNGHAQRFAEQVEQRARRDPRFRQAVACLHLGDDVPLEVRQRLAGFRLEGQMRI